jgi:hypothetical protein
MIASRINIALIRAHWSEILRVVASSLDPQMHVDRRYIQVHLIPTHP